MLILIDIDGTISDSRWRDDLAESRQWDAFHSQLIHDPPVKPMLKLLSTLSDCGVFLVGITGRPERYRQATMEWMLTHGVQLDELWMREDDNYSKAADLKPKIAEIIMQEHSYEEVLFIDDNEDICTAMRAAGFITLNIKLC